MDFHFVEYLTSNNLTSKREITYLTTMNVFSKTLQNQLKSILLLVPFIALSFTKVHAQDGEALFNSNCSACHNPVERVIGPPLKGAKARWEKNGAGDLIYMWVQDPRKALATGNSYVKKIWEYDASEMTPQAVSKEEIDAILNYADNYVEPTAVVDGGDVVTVVSSDDEFCNCGGLFGGNWLWWLLLGLILIILVFSLNGVRRRLSMITKEKDGEEYDEDETALEEAKKWAWVNKKWLSVAGFVLFCWAFVWGYQTLRKDIGIYECYKPEQPIAFSHKIHAGDNKIDCQYCHNSASKSKHSGIPTVNVCMNCHKGIKKPKSKSEAGIAEIAKIYKAAGFNPETGQYVRDSIIPEPIKWVKVHNLPDHVYFSHAQHVSVAKLDCIYCHGDMKKKTVGAIAPMESLNKDLEAAGETFRHEKKTLTMGWCINCHGKFDVDLQKNAYYTEIHDRLKKNKDFYKKVMSDGKVTVRELGGWECAKCHY